jgi:uncharacterized protein (DUF433 family)
MTGFDRITFEPHIMNGQACIRGMRIPVSLIINLVAKGRHTQQIIEEYPDLEPEDIRQSLEYASWLARDRVFSERLEAAG